VASACAATALTGASAVGVVVVESALGAVAIAANVVRVSAAVRSAAAASAGVIASAALPAAATEQCEIVVSDSSTNAGARVTCAGALATWTDLWACTATCAICHARTWTAIRWTGTAIARADGRACLNTSGRVTASPTASNSQRSPRWSRLRSAENPYRGHRTRQRV
jgi:hypothetical protein